MAILFIADLHLDDERPEITALFERYLASEEALTADAVYILGDLVEAWIGDDDDGTVHDLYGTPTLLMHGDILCTDDVAYQAVRRQVRTPAWQAQIMAMPLEARRAFAAKARSDSKAHTRSTDETIMDVNQAAVEETMRGAGVERLIHGHTHRPAIHDFKLDDKAAQRIVLGDWYEHGSVLRVTPDGVDLRGLALPG